MNEAERNQILEPGYKEVQVVGNGDFDVIGIGIDNVLNLVSHLLGVHISLNTVNTADARHNISGPYIGIPI